MTLAQVPAPRPPDEVARAVKLFGVVSVLLALLVIGLVLMTMLRRRRLRREQVRRRNGEEQAVVVDAWEEAGRRGEPMDRPPVRRRPDPDPRDADE